MFGSMLKKADVGKRLVTWQDVTRVVVVIQKYKWMTRH